MIIPHGLEELGVAWIPRMIALEFSARTLEELPSSVRRYVDRIAELIGVPIAMIGVGKEREATIVVQNPFAG